MNAPTAPKAPATLKKIVLPRLSFGTVSGFWVSLFNSETSRMDWHLMSVEDTFAILNGSVPTHGLMVQFEEGFYSYAKWIMYTRDNTYAIVTLGHEVLAKEVTI